MRIKVQHLNKRFGNFVAVDDVSFEVEHGSLAALLGPSGSGKSTILRILAGLESADSGSVFFDDQPATNPHARVREVGFVFQHYALFRHLTVADNVGFGLEVRGTPKAAVKQRVGELLELRTTSSCGVRIQAWPRCRGWLRWATACGSTRTSMARARSWRSSRGVAACSTA